MKLLLGDCIESMRGLPDCSIDAVVTDPPYGINFMGKAWDGKAIEEAASRPRDLSHVTRLTGDLDSASRKEIVRSGSAFQNRAGEAGAYDFSLKGNRAFQGWTEQWAREAFRVLKPGGHLLCFAATRTYHRMAAGVEDAGFEIRDQVAWMFGSGFPKSLDVSKAIDKLDASAERDERARRAQAWLREHVTAQQVNDATGSTMGHHLTTHPTQPFVPTPAMLDALRPLLPEVPAWFEELVADRAVESANFAAREVISERSGTTAPGFAGEQHRGGEATTFAYTEPHTDDARSWEGWGTALKPAFEPIVVARKPLSGTVAATVLAHGTGALNIDGCRIGFRDDADERESKDKNRHADFGSESGADAVYGDFSMVESKNYDAPGRWPANVVLDEDAGAILDAQTGQLAAGSHPALRSGRDSVRVYNPGWTGTEGERRPTDAGGASRFFYCAKVSRAERNAGLDGFDEQRSSKMGAGLRSSVGRDVEGTTSSEDRSARNFHPTVKPLDLMRWLLRLVTPPGGTVLDPFLGSGSTGCAAALEGFGFVGCEREPDYMAIAEARIAFWRKHGDDGLRICVEREASERIRQDRAATGQVSIFDFDSEAEGG